MATILGLVLVAFALVRYRFRGRGATNLALFLPMATPEIVMGTSLLALFLNLGMQRGFRTIVRQHHHVPHVRRGAAQRGIPPQANVMATLMFVVSVAASLVGLLAGRRR